MLSLAIRRLVMLLITIFMVSILAFLVPYVTEGDPVRAIIRSRVSELAIDQETVDRLRVSLGLDRPLAVQYLDWIKNVLRGDFGYSYMSRQPVSELILRAFLISFTLASSALLFAFVVSIPLGTMAALKEGKTFDNATIFLTQCFVAAPEYWLAPVGILVFSLYLGWLPSAGWQSYSSMVLPALVLSLRPMAYFTRVMRAAMIDVLRAPYLVAARSRGLSQFQSIVRHGLRNGISPVITVFAMWMASLLGGSLVVEVIFSIPGTGRLMYDAVIGRDIPLMQGSFVCLVALAVIITTITDMVYVLLNPMVRLAHAR